MFTVGVDPGTAEQPDPNHDDCLALTPPPVLRNSLTLNLSIVGHSCGQRDIIYIIYYDAMVRSASC